MHDPCADHPVRAALYDGYRAVRDAPPGFDCREPRLRAETLAHTVAGLADTGELSASERAFYDEAVVEAAERAVERA